MRKLLALCGGLALVITLSAASGQVPAAESSEAAPESAAIVLKLKAPKTTLGKVGDFVNEVQPGFGEAIKANTPVLGLAISNPALAGVDAEQAWSVIVFVESQQPPKVVFVIPATDTDAMKNALPPNFQFQAVEKLGLYSDDVTALGLARDCLQGKGTALWSKVDANSKKLFDESDLSVFVHVQQLAKTFHSELDQAESKIDALLTQLSTLTPEPQRQQLEMALNIYRELGKSAVRGVKDSRSFTMGVALSKDAIRFEDRLQVNDGSETAKFLSRHPAGELPLLNRLPAGKAVYFGLHANTKELVNWSLKNANMFLAMLPEDQRGQAETAMKQISELNFGDMAGYFDLDAKSSSGALQAGSVMEVTPANRMRDISRSMSAAMSEIKAAGFKQSTKLEPAAEKIGNQDVDRLTMKQEFDSAIDPLGMQQKMIDVLYGPNGVTQRMLYQENRALQMFGGELSQLEALLKSVSGSPASDSAVAAARQRLGKQANAVALADVARLVTLGIQIAAREKVIPFPIDEAQLTGLSTKPSFIGFAVSCEPNAARLQLEIPVQQAQGVAQIVALVARQARTPR